MEVERDHVLGRKITDEDDIFAAEDALMQQAQQAEGASADETLVPYEALGSQATFDRVLYDGAEFGHAGEVHVGSEEEMDFLGIPGPARGRPGARPARVTGRANGRVGVRRWPRRSRRARWPPTSTSPPCAASSTASSRRGTTAPASPTASPTPRCARSAAAPPPLPPAPPSSTQRIDLLREWATARVGASTGA